MPLTTPRLQVDDLCCSFDGRQVVSDVTLSVAEGQVMCLLGPSGCGKSTTLRAIAGVENPDSGTIRIDGAPVFGPEGSVPPEHRGVGLIFQDFALFPHLSVADNVAFGLKGRKKDKRARAHALLERVHLERYLDSYPPRAVGR